MRSNVGNELSYSLAASDSNRFEKMLSDLEQNMSSLGIASYGISLSSMEQVFFKVGERFKKQLAQTKPKEASTGITETNENKKIIFFFSEDE